MTLKLGFWEIAIFVYVQFWYETISYCLKAQFSQRVFFEALWLVNVKKEARVSEYEKNILPIVNWVWNEHNCE